MLWPRTVTTMNRLLSRDHATIARPSAASSSTPPTTRIGTRAHSRATPATQSATSTTRAARRLVARPAREACPVDLGPVVTRLM
ncbi:hypothetical protein [Micromonospora sp. NPDC049102]|uniref:hypothetical protein n=1 Tax=Micromonospora sp. NPDC049102 TaxID=3364265 RepID=UPI00372190FC